MVLPRVSYIIPVYNCGAYLDDCIAGIRMAMSEHAAVGEYEILLVDDGSKDGSGAICDRLAGQYANIRAFHQENSGVSAARNRGIDLAEGELLIFPDADDTIEPEKLLRLIRVMEDDDTIDLLIFGLSFDYYHHGECYRRDELAYTKDGKLSAEEWRDSLYQLYLSNSVSSVCNKIFRKRILDQYQLRFRRDMFLYEDLEFSIRYLICCGIICNSTDIVYHYRQQEDEGNAKRRLLRIDHLTEPVRKIENALEDMAVRQNLSEDTKNKAMAILPHLYLVLAREKIAVADRDQIRIVCADLAEWLGDKPENFLDSLSEGDRKYMRQAADGRVGRLIADRRYTAVRHQAAVAVKNTVFYKRLKK